MRVEFAFLCDAATEAAGKMNALVIGVDRLHVRELPVRHSRLVLVTRLAYGPPEVGAKRFVIKVVDADGRPVIEPVRGEMRLSMAEGATVARANLMVDVTNTEFRHYGPHEVSVTLDGEELLTMPLEVIPAA